MDREFLAVIDGTLGGPDAIFKLMEFYLRELKITTADKVLFVADGARWIWNRVGALLRRGGGKNEPGHRDAGLCHPRGRPGQIGALAPPRAAAERRPRVRGRGRRLPKGARRG